MSYTSRSRRQDSNLHLPRSGEVTRVYATGEESIFNGAAGEQAIKVCSAALPLSYSAERRWQDSNLRPSD